MKHCNKCNTTKPREEFGKSTQRKDGLKGSCKLCYNASNRSYSATPEAKARKKAYYKTYSSDPAVKAARSVYHKERNADPLVKSKMKVAGAKHRANTCPLYRSAQNCISDAKRRTTVPLSTFFGGLSSTDVINMTLPFIEERERLILATGVLHEVDHIVSIQAGGLHVKSNLQVLTKAANRLKGH